MQLQIDRTVLLNNAGFDSDLKASEGRFVGVLLVKTGKSYKHFTRDWYLHYKLTEEAFCPGERCPLPRYLDMADSGEYHRTGGGAYDLMLRRGRYTAILLGEPGANITVTLRLRSLRTGKLKIATSGTAELNTEIVDPVAMGDGHEFISRARFQDDVAGPRFDALVVGFALSTPAAAGFSWCFTYSDEPGFAPSSVICAGGGGGAIPWPLIDIGSTAYGVAYAYGFTTSGYFSHGYDADAVATSSRIPAVGLSIHFPAHRKLPSRRAHQVSAARPVAARARAEESSPPRRSHPPM